MKFTPDARPVFPEERLLLEILLGKPLAFINDSVWNGVGNNYYVSRTSGWPPRQSVNESMDVIRNVFNGQEAKF